MASGTIKRLVRDRGFGFIRDDNGQEWFFHRSAVTDGSFDHLNEGQRVAFETFAMQKNDEGMKAAAKKYRTFADRAKAADDPIYAALIADMERQPYLYMKGAPHPRNAF